MFNNIAARIVTAIARHLPGERPPRQAAVVNGQMVFTAHDWPAAVYLRANAREIHRAVQWLVHWTVRGWTWED